MKKRMISLLLAAVMVFAILPGMGMDVQAISIDQVQQKLASWKSTLNGKYWNYFDRSVYDGNRSYVEEQLRAIATSGALDNPSSSNAQLGVTNSACGGNVFASGCRSNYFSGGWQCFGFGWFIEYALFQSTYGYNPSDWYVYSGGDLGSISLQPGDYVRFNNHTIIVQDTSGDALNCVEAWGGSGCKISWSPGFNWSEYTSASSLLNAMRSGGGTVYRYKHIGGASSGTSSGDYLSQCKFEYSYCNVKVTEVTTLKTLPCSKGTNAESKDVYTCSVGEIYKATGLYQNTQGNWWYRTNYNGQNCYIHAGNTTVTEILQGAYVSSPTGPSALNVGDRFSIRGVVTSDTDYTKILRAGAYITALPEDSTRICDLAEGVSGNSYSLLNSAVDMAMTFNTLGTGWYRYRVYAEEESYYWDGAQLARYTKTPIVWYCDFSVGNAGAKPSEKPMINLDVNSYIDGNHGWDAIGYGTFDVYINGEKVANDVNDWCQPYPAGTNFVVNDIKAVSGYVNRSQSGYSGTISGDADVHVDLIFETKKTQYTNSILLNGKPISFDQAPVNINGRILVPVRAILEAMGASVNWDKYAKKVTASRNGTTVELIIDQLYLSQRQNGILAKWAMDVAAKIINGRTLIPARAVAEAFGCKVDWDPQNRNVIITT